MYIRFGTQAGIAQLSEFASFVIIPKKVLTKIGECRSIYTNKIRYLPSSVASTQSYELTSSALIKDTAVSRLFLLTKMQYPLRPTSSFIYKKALRALS